MSDAVLEMGQERQTSIPAVMSCTMPLATPSRILVSYFTSRGTPVASANAFPSVLEVTSTCGAHKSLLKQHCSKSATMQQARGMKVNARMLLVNHLYSHKFRDLPILSLYRGDSQQIPEWRPVSPIVQQPNTAYLPMLDRIPDLGNFLGISALPLKKAAAKAHTGQSPLLDIWITKTSP